MEKKTKKLQLRKETIAVLNGERMSHVVGGFIQECNSDEHCPGAEVCRKDHYGNNICVPMDITTSDYLCDFTRVSPCPPPPPPISLNNGCKPIKDSDFCTLIIC